MTIGLSLTIGYLTGANDSAGDMCLSAALGKPLDGLACLKDNGITSIELQGFGPDASPDRIQDAVGLILDSGMHISLHGYLSDNTEGRLSGNIHSQLLSIVDSFEGQQEEAVVVVHALAGPMTCYRTMVETTVRALARLSEHIRIHDFPVTIGLEISRYHGVESPGTTYDGLLEIARHLGDAEVGFCWDMGHTSSSVLQKRLPPIPSADFVAKVIHTHIHDLSPEGKTHWPLTESCTHLVSGTLPELASRIDLITFSRRVLSQETFAPFTTRPCPAHNNASERSAHPGGFANVQGGRSAKTLYIYFKVNSCT